MKKAVILMLLSCLVFFVGCSSNKVEPVVENKEVVTVNNSKETVVEIHNTVTTPKDEVVVETVIEVVTKVEEPKPLYYNVTSEERELLARLLYLEASICSSECKEAVVSVIFNRLDSGRWTKDMNDDGKITLFDIVYYPEAFTPARNIPNTTPDEACYIAVGNVIANGPTIPTQVRYFRTNYDFKWDGYAHYCTMNNLYFGYFIDWENGAW